MPMPGPVPTVPVRVADVSDAATVGGLLADFNTEFEAPGPDAATLGERFTALLARRDVVVMLSGGPEGTGFAFLTLRPTPYYAGPLAQLEELYVRPERRDQGTGTALLTAAVDLVRARGAGEIHINVDEVDTDARRFYERHGFVNVEPGRDYRMLCYLREL